MEYYFIGAGTSIRMINNQAAVKLVDVSAKFAYHVFSRTQEVYITKKYFTIQTLDTFIGILKGEVILEFSENDIPEIVDLAGT